MSTNVLHLQPPPAAAAAAREPLEAAVLEVSGRIRAAVGEHRRYHRRLLELKSGGLAVRRSRPRELPLDPRRPLTIYSIEEAAPEPQAKQVQRA